MEAFYQKIHDFRDFTHVAMNLKSHQNAWKFWSLQWRYETEQKEITRLLKEQRIHPITDWTAFKIFIQTRTFQPTNNFHFYGLALFR